MPWKEPAFVAYSSHDVELAKTIFEGIQRANSKPITVQYEPWIFNDIPGIELLSPINDKISKSKFIVADITYLNQNVVYEIGYAIAKQKRVFLIKSASNDVDKILMRDTGIFDTLGYHEYGNADSLSDRLCGHIDFNVPNISVALDQKAPVYVVEPPRRTTAATLVVSKLKKAGYRYRSFNPSEDVRLASGDAIRGVTSSAGVILLLQTENDEGDKAHNIRVMFVAGLADGLDIPRLILAPTGFAAPLDVRDTVKLYSRPEDIASYIADFCPLINRSIQKADPLPVHTGGLLQSLSIGDPTAENEMTTLGMYYLQTDQYQRSLRGEANLVVGRKGSGKTALFIQIRDKIRSDKRNIVVDLKPEGYQLIKLKEEIFGYLADGAQQHLITAFWEYLILLEVAYKLLEKDRIAHLHNHEIYDLYMSLKSVYFVDGLAIEGDFSERLLNLSNSVASRYKDKFYISSGRRLTNDQITQILYRHDIKELKLIISKYLEKKESVWILFDNLDKGWSTQGVDALDGIVLRCLIDAGHKIEREMKRVGHPFYCITFVRNDVYDAIMSNSADYGKEMRVTLDWTDSDLLRELLRLRLVAGLKSVAPKTPFNQLWRTLCVSHVDGQESSDYFIERSLMRPRNLIKILNHSRGFANNFGRQKIEKDDIEKGMRAYSLDLLTELDHELSDVIPIAKDILYYFIDCKSKIYEKELNNILQESPVPSDCYEEVVDFLLYYGVLGVELGEGDCYIFDVNYDIKLLKIRMSRMSGDPKYVVNPAFWPALSIQSGEHVT
jgi:hypothetical protein